MAFLARNQFAQLFGRSINFPSVQEAKWITDSVRYSPDLGWLEQFEYQLLFCPDDTKSGGTRHSLISDSQFIATAYSANKFNYWYQETGDDRLPIPVMSPEKATTMIRFFPPPLKVKGELRLVRTPQFRELDSYKRNTVQFRRKRVNVFIPYRELQFKLNTLADDESSPFRPLPRCLQQTHHAILSSERMSVIRCWMYVAMTEYWDQLLDGGFRGFKTVNYYESKRPWLQEYYDYPNQPI